MPLAQGPEQASQPKSPEHGEVLYKDLTEKQRENLDKFKKHLLNLKKTCSEYKMFLEGQIVDGDTAGDQSGESFVFWEQDLTSAYDKVQQQLQRITMMENKMYEALENKRTVLVHNIETALRVWAERTHRWESEYDERISEEDENETEMPAQEPVVQTVAREVPANTSSDSVDEPLAPSKANEEVEQEKPIGIPAKEESDQPDTLQTEPDQVIEQELPIDTPSETGEQLPDEALMPDEDIADISTQKAETETKLRDALAKLKESLLENLTDMDGMLERRETLYRKSIEGTNREINNLSRWNPFNIPLRRVLRKTLQREKQSLQKVQKLRKEYRPKIAALRTDVQNTDMRNLDSHRLVSWEHEMADLRGVIAKSLRGADTNYRAVGAHLTEVNALLDGYKNYEAIEKNRESERLRRIQVPGQTVYVRRGNAMERGVVVQRDGEFFVENTNEKWSVNINDVEKDGKGMPKLWLPNELEVTGQDDFEHILAPDDVGADFMRRKFEYMEKSSTLSKAEFHELFGGDIRQANVGNCYLIASFVALQNCDHVEAILRTSIKKVDEATYSVRIPLGVSSGEEIVITKEEMYSTQLVGERNMRSVYAADGWKLLEAAFTKKTTGEMDREATEGGRSYKALKEYLAAHSSELVGDPNIFEKYGIIFSVVAGNKEAIDASFNEELMEHRERAEKILDAYSNGQYLIHLGSRVHSSGSDTVTYQIGTNTFYHNHAYTLTGVDAESKTVTVVNPHNSGAPISLTYDELFNAFSGMEVSTIDYKSMFT